MRRRSVHQEHSDTLNIAAVTWINSHHLPCLVLSEQNIPEPRDSISPVNSVSSSSAAPRSSYRYTIVFASGSHPKLYGQKLNDYLFLRPFSSARRHCRGSRAIQGFQWVWPWVLGGLEAA